MGGLDPSKLTPQAMAELSDLMRTLTPAQMSKMQTIMHNAMAGFDVTQDVADFEASLPSTFRERMARIMYLANGVDLPPKEGVSATATAVPHAEAQVVPPLNNEQEARLVILRSVSQGLMAPEDALKVLFPEH
jgi:hypothetical protein